jgi:competence protein ComEC
MDSATTAGRLSAGEIFHRPLVSVAIAIVAGTALGAMFPGQVKAAGAALVVFGTLAVVSILRRRPALVFPLFLFFSLGYLCIQPWLSDDLPTNHVSRFVDQGKFTILGRIDDRPEHRQGRTRFVLEAREFGRGTSRHAVRGKIRVTAQGDLSDLGMGDLVTFRGHLRDIRNFGNPGGFDYRRHMALEGIRARSFAQQGSVTLVSPASRRHWRVRLDGLRSDLAGRMERTLNSHPESTISTLKALAIGDRSGITPHLREAFTRAGVGHVLAISGLHIGMVAAVTFAAARWLLSWIPFMLRRAWTRKGAALISLAAVVAYAVLAGLSASTQRAAIMVAVFLLTYWVGRPHDWLNALAMAALVIAVIHPPAVMSISFQLSFAAVAVILFGLARVSHSNGEQQPGIFQRYLRRLLAFLWVSILAILGTLPLVMRYFNEVSLAGPLVNLLVVPLVGMVVVPGGLLGVLLAGVAPPLADGCWQIAAWSLDFMLAIITAVSQWSFAAVQTVTPSEIEIVLFYALAGVVLAWFRGRRYVWVLCIVLAAGLADGVYWGYQRFFKRNLDVTVLDVGQGSANLVQLPGGYTILVDGGGFGDNRVFDVGRSIVAPYLGRLKIRTLDLVVLSHANSDHLNGLIYLLEHFTVKAVWSNHEPADTMGYRLWLEAIRRREITHLPFARLDRRMDHKGVSIEILAPSADFMARREAERWRDLNNNSLVLRVCKEDVSIIFPGDICRDAENEIVRRLGPERLRSTILVVPHHGSRYSSSSTFLEAVRPDEAVVSAGWHNRFGFPHGAVLGRLEDVSSRVWRTDTDGAIRIQTDGSAYTVRPTRSYSR